VGFDVHVHRVGTLVPNNNDLLRDYYYYSERLAQWQW